MNDYHTMNSRNTTLDNEPQGITMHDNPLFANEHVIMLFVAPATGRIIDANPAACAFYGFSREDMLKLNMEDITVLPKQVDKPFLFQHRLANGTIRYVEVYDTLVKIKGQELIYSIIKDITVRTETAERLQKTLEEVEDLYNHSPCGYYCLDEKGIFVRINDTMLKWLGYSREEIVGKKNFMEVITPEGVKTFLENFPEFKKNGWIKDLEFEFVRKNSTLFSALISATAVMDSKGNYMMSRSSCHDITEHKKMKDELHIINTKLESMVIERTNQLQDMNAELEESNALLEKEIFERKNIEKALKRSEELYRKVYEYSPLAFGIWDTEFRFVDWNKRAEEFFGWSKEEVVGKKFMDFLVPPEIKENISKIAMDIRDMGVERITLNENVTKNGEILLYEWHNSLLNDGAGNLIGIISIGLDKTESVKAEKTIQETKEQIEVANEELSKINSSLKEEIKRRIAIEDTLIKAKLEAEQANMAKTQFLANMSHEIRTPMNGIIGMTDLTLMTELQEEQREYLMIVKSSTALLLRVLNDILDYSKIESGKMNLVKEPFHIRKTSNEVVELFAIAAKQKKLYIKLHIDERIPYTLIGDSIRLRQILSNLVGNSVKFTHYGGVTITIAIVRRQFRKIILKFMVTDTGIGIPHDKVNKLFKRFSQVDDSNSRQFGGTGLGLAISKKLIEMMDGEIGMESREEEGSEFFFTAAFDVDDEAVINWEKKHESTEVVGINTEKQPKILLAEDDEVSRNVGNLWLTKQNLQVCLAQDGEEAFAMFKNEEFDIILLDVNMPYLDGYSVTRLIRLEEEKKHCHTPIIAMTAYALTGDKEKCIAAGMDDYISKPIDFKELSKLIDKWLMKK